MITILLLIGMISIATAGIELGLEDENPSVNIRPTTTSPSTTTLNTNSSDFWDNLDVPTDITGSEFWYNHTADLLGDDIWVNEAGDTMTGNLTMDAVITSSSGTVNIDENITIGDVIQIGKIGGSTQIVAVDGADDNLWLKTTGTGSTFVGGTDANGKFVIWSDNAFTDQLFLESTTAHGLIDHTDNLINFGASALESITGITMTGTLNGDTINAGAGLEAASDTFGLYLGASQDSHIYYDGSDTLFKNIVGAGEFKFNSTVRINDEWSFENTGDVLNINWFDGFADNIYQQIQTDGTVNYGGNLVPFTDSAHDLGTTNYKWREVFMVDDINIVRDNKGLLLGAGGDVRIDYDGSHTQFDNLVGSGEFRFDNTLTVRYVSPSSLTQTVGVNSTNRAWGGVGDFHSYGGLFDTEWRVPAQNEYAYGVWGRGVASGGSATSRPIGVYGEASAPLPNQGTTIFYGLFGNASGNTGSTTTSIGVYGIGEGSDVNWAGHFQGNINVTGNLYGDGSTLTGLPLTADNSTIWNNNSNSNFITNSLPIADLPMYFTCGENSALDNSAYEWSCGGNGEVGTNLNIHVFEDMTLTDVGITCNTGTGTANVSIYVNNAHVQCNVVSTGTSDTASCDVDISSGDEMQPYTVTDTGHSNCVVTWRAVTR